MANPTTREELKRAVTAAAILRALRDAHTFELIPSALNVDVPRAQLILDTAVHNGIYPDLPGDHADSITDADGPVLPLPP